MYSRIPDETLFESFAFPFFDFNFSTVAKVGTGFPIDHQLVYRALTSLPDAPGAKGRRGLYVHIPFCDTICTFCPFNKSVGNDERIERYLDALLREADLVAKLPRFSSWNFNSVYVGGGTPSVLNPQQASDLISMLRERFSLVESPEITFEVEAKSATPELLHAVAKAGATRISFGIQTLQPDLRKIVNLTASLEQIKRTIEVGTELFSDVNADMIVGFPGQSTESAVEDLREAASLGASSISLYPMDYSTVMSKLLDRMRSGSLPKPAPVKDRWDMFHRGRDVLLETYEEQNMYCFGKPSVEPCNYMFATLYGGYFDSFVGLGCGAYTSFPGMTSHNIYHEEQYVKACLSEQLPVERVSLGHAYEKSLVFLPKRLGGDLTEAKYLGLEGFYSERVQELLEEGAIEINGAWVSLTPEGKRMYHRIMVGFLSDMNRRIYERRCCDVMEDLGLASDGSLADRQSKVRVMPAAWHLGVGKSGKTSTGRWSKSRMLDLSHLHRSSLESGYTAVCGVPSGIDLSRGQVIGLNGQERFMLDSGIFSYQPPTGLATLREEYGTTLHGSQEVAASTIVTAGAKQALFLAFAFFGPRTQRIFVPTPGWSPYTLLARALGFEPQVYDPCDPMALASLVSMGPESLVVLNYPHNPTGACLTAGHLDELVNAAHASGSQIISDEVYRALVPDAPSIGKYLSCGFVTVVDSISKWAGAAGLRIGFLVGSAELLEHSLSLIGVINSGTCSIAQSWAAHHLASPRLLEQAAKASARSIIELEKDLVRSGHTVLSSGAIYLWVKGGPTFCIDGNDVTGVPGHIFGQPGFSRLCPTASLNPWNAVAREQDSVL